MALDGQKVWTSQARQADWAICLARTDPEAPKHKGISYFLVDMRSPGVEVRPLREANGSYLFNEVFLTDVFVPDGRLVGRPGDGWRLARTTLGNERVTIAGGLGRRQELPSDYLPDPDQPSRRPGSGRGAGRVRRADRRRAGLRRPAAAAAAAPDRGGGARRAGRGLEGSVLKVVAAWNATSLRRAVLGWHGADAAAFGGPAGDAAQRYLSLPPTLLGGGTLEIQLNVIAERVLGLPR